MRQKKCGYKHKNNNRQKTTASLAKEFLEELIKRSPYKNQGDSGRRRQ